ncbi:MAG: radical SAM protein [Alphaproteobacteria bacterium]|nr:radical SAM protein [Alphaproteobacteria bacterium]
MHIVLINPSVYLTQSQFRRPPDALPIGLGIITRCLREGGHRVSIIDMFGLDLARSEVEQELDRLRLVGVDAFGITAMSVQYAQVQWLSQAIRSRFGDKRIVVGGALAQYNYLQIIELLGIDVAVMREGEPVAVRVFTENELDAIPGIAFNDGGKAKLTAPLALPKRRAETVWPDYDGFPIDHYLRAMEAAVFVPQKHGRVTIIRYFNTISGRGCPYSCTFCSLQFPTIQYRNLDNVLDEIAYWQAKFPINSIMFLDELTLVNHRRIVELATKMASTGLLWSANYRVNLVKRRDLELMKAAGLWQVTFGVESGSDDILTAMHKKVTSAQSRRAIETALDAGVRVNIQMIFGFPGENAATVEETITFFNGLPVEVGFAILTPLPGSNLYATALGEGKIPDEEAWLLGLEGGFNKVRINFTEWSDEEFLKVRERATRTINERAAQGVQAGSAWQARNLCGKETPGPGLRLVRVSDSGSVPAALALACRDGGPNVVALESSLASSLTIEAVGNRLTAQETKQAAEMAGELADIVVAFAGGQVSALVDGVNLLTACRDEIVGRIAPLYGLDFLMGRMAEAGFDGTLTLAVAGSRLPDQIGRWPVRMVLPEGSPRYQAPLSWYQRWESHLPERLRGRIRWIELRVVRRMARLRQLALEFAAKRSGDGSSQGKLTRPSSVLSEQRILWMWGGADEPQDRQALTDAIQRGAAVVVVADSQAMVNDLAGIGITALCPPDLPLSMAGALRVAKARRRYRRGMLVLEGRFSDDTVEKAQMSLLRTAPLETLSKAYAQVVWLKQVFDDLNPDQVMLAATESTLASFALDMAKYRAIPVVIRNRPTDLVER